MATELLSIGYPIQMVSGTIYALPSVPVRMFCETTTATIQQSNLVTFTTSTTMTLTQGQCDLSGGFVRSTGATVNVKLTKLS